MGELWASVMRLRLRALFVLLSIGIFTGCQSNQVAEPNQSLAIPDTTTSITAGDLRIAPMDLLDIRVFGVSELEGTYQVAFTGEIKLPLIGEVEVVGLSPSELALRLERDYGEKYLQDPDVSVTIKESVGRKVTIEGAVSRPGLFPVQGKLTLLQAIALAGGTTSSSNPRNVVLFRQIEGQRHAASFDLLEIRKGTAFDPPIYGNDIVVVDGSDVRENYRDLLRSVPLLALLIF